MTGLKSYLWRFLTKRMHLQWTMRSGLEVKIRNYSDWCTYNELFVDGEYDEAIRYTLDHNQKVSSIKVLDLGANLGYFTLRFGDLFLQAGLKQPVHLYLAEASPYVIDDLEKRTDCLVHHGMHVNVLSGLVGKKEGKEQLNFAKESNQHFINTGTTHTITPTGRSQNVSYLNLDTIIPQGDINLIKCDIEGAEFFFIDNYPDLLKRTHCLVLEFHNNAGSIDSAKAKLREYGFLKSQVLREDDTFPVVMFLRSQVN